MKKNFMAILAMLVGCTALADWESVTCTPLRCIGCAVECTIREDGIDYKFNFDQHICLELNVDVAGDRTNCAKKIEDCIKSSPIKRISQLSLTCE